VNREDGKRTAPSALNRHPVDVYAVLADAIYRYEPVEHVLIPVAEGDFRKLAGKQDYVYTAPLNLVYVADLAKLKDLPVQALEEEKLKWVYVEAGHKAENVHIYCASEGLGVTTRALIDKERFSAAAKLRPDRIVVLAQTIGYPQT